jgi:hypothetical protein
LGLPWPFEQQISIDIQGFNPGVDADSAIELIAIPQARGRDYSSNAHPPNLGIAALRFMVDDALMLVNRLNTTDGASLTSPLNEEFIAPYGWRKLFSYSAPDGVRIEFCSLSRNADIQMSR